MRQKKKRRVNANDNHLEGIEMSQPRSSSNALWKPNISSRTIRGILANGSLYEEEGVRRQERRYLLGENDTETDTTSACAVLGL